MGTLKLQRSISYLSRSSADNTNFPVEKPQSFVNSRLSIRDLASGRFILQISLPKGSEHALGLTWTVAAGRQGEQWLARNAGRPLAPYADQIIHPYRKLRPTVQGISSSTDVPRSEASCSWAASVLWIWGCQGGFARLGFWWHHLMYTSCHCFIEANVI